MLDRRFEIPDPSLPPRERTGSAPSAPLVPFEPKPVRLADLAGRRIEEVSESVGTYGMGGAGFFGLKFDNGKWLVIAVRGAASWMSAEGKPLEDFFYQDHKRKRPWLTDDDDELSPRIIGHSVAALDVQRIWLRITLDDGFSLEISESADARPIFEGSKERRSFDSVDDLRRNVFLAPTDEIWV